MTMNYPSRKKDNQRVVNRDINAATRATTAIQLRAQMLTYEEIAKRCGYASPSACRKAILREMDRTIVQDVQELRKVELQMLNIMHSKCWQKFMDEKNPWAHTEVDRILAISERRSRLMGLDVPIENAVAANMVIVRELPPNYLQLDEVKAE